MPDRQARRAKSAERLRPSGPIPWWFGPADLALSVVLPLVVYFGCGATIVWAGYALGIESVMNALPVWALMIPIVVIMAGLLALAHLAHRAVRAWIIRLAENTTRASRTHT